MIRNEQRRVRRTANEAERERVPKKVADSKGQTNLPSWGQQSEVGVGSPCELSFAQKESRRWWVGGKSVRPTMHTGSHLSVRQEEEKLHYGQSYI